MHVINCFGTFTVIGQSISSTWCHMTFTALGRVWLVTTRLCISQLQMLETTPTSTSSVLSCNVLASRSLFFSSQTWGFCDHFFSVVYATACLVTLGTIWYFDVVWFAVYIITDQFSGPGRALGPVCLCPDNNFRTKWPMT